MSGVVCHWSRLLYPGLTWESLGSALSVSARGWDLCRGYPRKSLMETSHQASGEQDFLVSPIPHDPEGSWGQSLCLKHENVGHSCALMFWFFGEKSTSTHIWFWHALNMCDLDGTISFFSYKNEGTECCRQVRVGKWPMAWPWLLITVQFYDRYQRWHQWC